MTGATDPRLSFGPAAEIYDQIRPTYPPALYDDLFDEPALRSGSERPLVVEVGPGTGKATRDLLRLGARVHGIEISPAMAAGGDQTAGHHPHHCVLTELTKPVGKRGRDSASAETCDACAQSWLRRGRVL